MNEYGALVERYWQGKTGRVMMKSCPTAILSTTYPTGKARDRTQAFTMKGPRFWHCLYLVLTALTSMCCAYTQMTPRMSAVTGAAISPALRKASPIAYSADPMFPFNRCISVSRNLRVGPRSKDIHYNLTEMWAQQSFTIVRDQNHFTQFSRTGLVL